MHSHKVAELLLWLGLAAVAPPCLGGGEWVTLSGYLEMYELNELGEATSVTLIVDEERPSGSGDFVDQIVNYIVADNTLGQKLLSKVGKTVTVHGSLSNDVYGNRMINVEDYQLQIELPLGHAYGDPVRPRDTARNGFTRPESQADAFYEGQEVKDSQ